MTLYATESGGAVFAVGSLAWTLALPVDEQVGASVRRMYFDGFYNVESPPTSDLDSDSSCGAAFSCERREQ